MIAAADTNVLRVTSEGLEPSHDAVAIEEPLEIRLAWGPAMGPGRGIAITLRTPGDDLALALGFLHAEGILRSLDDVESVRHFGPASREDGTSDVVKVQLRRGATVDLAQLGRNTYLSSSCGVCSKTSLEAVRMQNPPAIGAGPVVTSELVISLPRRLRRDQRVIDRAGAFHTAALFDGNGRLLRVREDVGRHNAVDKVIGAEMMAGTLPRSNAMLFVSGRASFEVVQKAVMAGVPILAALGAPSSLAVDLAREHGMTLLGFVAGGHFNVYCGSARVEHRPTSALAAPTEDSTETSTVAVVARASKSRSVTSTLVLPTRVNVLD